MSAPAEQWTGEVVVTLPPCPTWCAGHPEVEDELGGEHTHRATLYGFDLIVDGQVRGCTVDVAQDERVDWPTRQVLTRPPLLWVSYEGESGHQRAVIDVELEGAVGARALADALLVAAEVIEGRRS